MVAMEGLQNLKSLDMDQLAEVITLHPWFGAARRELCERMAKVGGSEWGKEQYADAAMYVASRSIIHDIVRSTRKEDYSDKDVQALLKEYITDRKSPDPDVVATAPTPVPTPVPESAEGTSPVGGAGAAEGPRPIYRRTVKVVGGDFFSSDQYDSVRQSDDNYFSKFKAGKSDDDDKGNWKDPELGFCTETLAWIYAEQGYYAEAKKIYSRLILRYPEKIAYFASLIEKLDKKEN